MSREQTVIDISALAQPKERFDREDGIEMLKDAQLALDQIGKKLEIMRKIAYYASDPKCDPVKRIAMNLLFSSLKKEIDDWANTSCCGVKLLSCRKESEIDKSETAK